MRTRTPQRRIENRSASAQEKRYCMEKPLPENFGIKRPLSEKYARLFSSVFIEVIKRLENEKVEDIDSLLNGTEPQKSRLDPNLGLKPLRHPYIEVFPAKRLPEQIAKALKVGRKIGLTEAGQGLSPEFAGASRVEAQTDGFVLAKGHRGIDLKIVSPKIIHQSRLLHTALGELEIPGICLPDPQRQLPEDKVMRIKLLRSEYQIKPAELGMIVAGFEESLSDREESVSSVYFGKSEVYPEQAADLSMYLR